MRRYHCVTSWAATSTPDPSGSWADPARAQDMPILPESLAELRRLRSAATLDAQRLQAVTLKDPALAAHILVRFAAKQPPQGGRRAESLSHAILLLGVEPLVEHLTTLPALPGKLGPDAALGYRRTMATACHAGALAGVWTPRSWRTRAESIAVSARLSFISELLVWAQHPQASDLFAGGPDPEERQRTALGATVAEIGVRVASSWNLPEFAALAFAPTEIDQEGCDAARLAGQIARTAAVNWHSPAYREDLARAAECMQVAPDLAMARIHSVTARTARSLWQPGDLCAARTLLLGPDDPHWTNTPGNARSVPEEDPIARTLQDLASCRSKKIGLNQAIRSVLVGMQAGLGLDRAAFALLSRNRTRLTVRDCVKVTAMPAQADLSNLQIELSGSHLFVRLMQRSSGVRMHADNRAKIASMLPEAVHEKLSRQGFFAMSVFAKGKPIGLFYADCETSPEHLNEAHYRHFKHLCKETGKAIEARG